MKLYINLLTGLYKPYIIQSIKGNPRVHKYKREEERTYGFTIIKPLNDKRAMVLITWIISSVG